MGAVTTDSAAPHVMAMFCALILGYTMWRLAKPFMPKEPATWFAGGAFVVVLFFIEFFLIGGAHR